MRTYRNLLDEARGHFADELASYRETLGQPRFIPLSLIKDQLRIAVKKTANGADAIIPDLIRDRPDFLDFNNNISRLSPRDGILTALEISLNEDLADEAASEHVRGQDETTLPTLLMEAASALRGNGENADAARLASMTESGEFERAAIARIAAKCGERLWVEILGAVSAREEVMTSASEATAPSPR